MQFPDRRHPMLRRYAAALFALCLAAVVYLSLVPGEMSPAGGLGLDKLQHAFAYFVLTGLGLMAVGRRLWLLLLIAGLGAGMEIAQAIMPHGRQGDLIDLAANLSGQALAWGLWTLCRARRSRSRR
ncbi:hypothetical protein [Phenylobacterium sp.]|uniref:hypothetical protein n=1 Tax=Phenylobacterium sp. TaxID=1871053 RepID=UPI002FDB54C5